MKKTPVLILSGKSLFAEGVANRLREFPDSVDVRMIDPTQPCVISKIEGLNPSVIMLDANDQDAMGLCSLSGLIFNYPDLKVMRLDAKEEIIQVISSQQYRAVDAGDLVKMITLVEDAQEE